MGLALPPQRFPHSNAAASTSSTISTSSPSPHHHSKQQHTDTACWAVERPYISSHAVQEGPGRKLRIHCCTFNMGSKVPPKVPAALLGLHTVEAPDLVAVATQVQKCIMFCSIVAAGAITVQNHQPLGFWRLETEFLASQSRSVHSL
jgi:hypothetical protein